MLSIPVKHHHLPEFYLRRWTTAESGGRVYGYRRPHSTVAVRPYAPSAVGFEPNLYAIEGRSDPAAKQEVESRFMSPLDAKGAEALSFMEGTGRFSMDPALRDGWARFLMSLLFRSPRKVQWLRGRILKGDVATMKTLSDAYRALRVVGDPESFEDYRTKMGSSLLEEAVALLMRRMVDNEMIGSHLVQMPWSFVSLPELEHGLLTSDSPVIMSNGLGNPNGFLILPVAPDRYFLAVNRPEVAASFTGRRPRQIERAFNDAVVRQAEKWVIGSTPRQPAFVERRLRKPDDPWRTDVLHATTWQAPF